MARAGSGSEPRVARPDRRQLILQPTDLERLIADDHAARGIWAFVERLDLSSFYDEIAARGSEPGRSATDPRVLLSLWIYANAEAVGSARLLEKLCERDAPYRWICGGVSVNHHTLSDFRTRHGEKIDALLTQTLAVLMKHGVVKLRRVAQDGMKVRASAGAASFRRKTTLERLRQEAHEQVTRLKAELDEGGSASVDRVKVAEQRAAERRHAAVEAALRELDLVESQRKERDARRTSAYKRRKEARASTTDTDSRVMKMADGGFRPAYNVQLATDESGVIVGADVTNNGTDQPHVKPMLDEIVRRTGRTPVDYLVDGGFVSLENIEMLSSRSITMYAPTPVPRNKNTDRYARNPGDSDFVADWHRRSEGDLQGPWSARRAE